MATRQPFEGVLYEISPTLALQRERLVQLLKANGAAEAKSMSEATHVLTDSLVFEGSEDAQKDALVTPTWLERSLTCGTKCDPQYFSPDPAKLFSGCCISTDHLPIGDEEVIRAAVQALGGQFRQGLTRDVSHLIVLSPEGDKYHTAMQFGKVTGMKVVLPHWFDDSFKAQHLMDTAPYEFPDPPLLKPQRNANIEGPILSKNQKTLLRAIELAENGSSKRLKEDLKGDVWQGRKILLSATLALEVGRRETVEDLIERTGGTVVRASTPFLEEDAIEEVDVLVTRYREGSAYLRALQLHKTIGTLAWLFHVEYSGSLTSPTKHLLHFPVRAQKIPELVGKKITVSNYTGETREYLKVLITHMGAEFSKEMKRSDTFVVVACSKTHKTEKAHEWGVEIVNHLWLEDCYTEWRMAPFTNSRYTHSFPSDQLQLATCSRGLGNITFEGELKELGLSPPKAGKKPATGREERGPGEILADVKNYKRVATSSFQEREEVEAAVVGGMDSDVGMEMEDIAGPELSTPALKHDTVNAQASSSTLKPPSPTKSTATVSYQQAIEATENPQLGSPSTAIRQPHPVEEPVSDGLSPAPVPKKRKKISLEGKNVAPAFTDKPQSKSRRWDPADEDGDEPLPLDELRSVARSGKTIRERVDAEKPVKIKALSKLKEQAEAVEKAKEKSKRRVDVDEDETDVIESPVTKPTRPPKPAPRSKQVPYPAKAGDSHSRPVTKAAAGRPYEPQVDDLSGNNHEYWYSSRKAKPPRSKEERQETLEVDGGRTKRGAANKAASKLKSDMEDRNRFEKEVKHGQMLGTWGGKRAQYKRGRDPEHDEILDRRPPKKRKSMPESGEESVMEGSVIFKREDTGIRFVTTLVNLDDKQIESARKLGMRRIEEPARCTHLVVENGVVRTEKFLCAMAYGVPVVTRQWVTDSIAQGRALPTDDYLLATDLDFKKTVGCNIDEALRRAKVTGRTLFKGHTFYIDKQTKLNFPLLERVIKAAGGQAYNTLPPLRSVEDHSDDRHVISSLEDKDGWQTLAARGIPIYTEELIFRAILRQQLDPTSKDFQLAGDSESSG